MGLSFSVFNKFKAIDGVTAPVKKMEKSVGKFGKTATRAFDKADRKASKFAKTVKGFVVGGAILAATAAMSLGVSKVTTEFVQFDDAIVAAGARFKDIGPDVDNFVESLTDIKKAAREAGATTEFTSSQAAQSLDFLARTGFKSTTAIKSLAIMIDLATASGEELARSSDIASDLLGAFGMNSNVVAEKVANLSHLSDVLVKTVNGANVTLEDLFDTMKQVAPIATGVLNAKLEDVVSLTAILANNGLKGSDAMTALKNIFLRLAAPTSEARKLIDALNISMANIATGKPRKMVDVLEELGKKTAHLGELEQAEIFDILFGKRAIAGGKNIMNNIKNVKNFRDSLNDIEGVSHRTAEAIRTGLGKRLASLNSALIEFGFQIIENFEIRGKNGIDVITDAVRQFDVEPIVRSFERILIELNDFVDVLKFVGRMIDSIFISKFSRIDSDIIPSLGTLAGIFLSIKLALIGINGVITIMNGLLALNPFVLAIIGIALFISGLKVLIKHEEKLQAGFDSMMGSMGNSALSAINRISNIFLIAGKFWGNIFSSIGGKIENMFSGIGDFINNALLDLNFDGVVISFENLGEKIKNIFLGIGDFIGNIFSGLGEKFEKFASGIGGKVLGAFGFDQDQQQAPQRQTTPISPNTGLINTVRQETNNRSTVDVNLNNVPEGSKVKQEGSSQGFNLNVGYSGGR